MNFASLALTAGTLAAGVSAAVALYGARRLIQRADGSGTPSRAGELSRAELYRQLLEIHGQALRVSMQVEYEDGSTSTLAELDRPQGIHAERAIEAAAHSLRTA
jgi:hypothetical protein